MPPYVIRYYTVIISKLTGKAKAVCCQMQDSKQRADACAKSGNFFHTLADAKAIAEKINELFLTK